MKFIINFLLLAIIGAIIAVSGSVLFGTAAFTPFCGNNCQSQIKSTVSNVRTSALSSTKSSATIQDLLKSSEPGEVWGNSGVVMFNVAAQLSATRNPAGQPLTVAQKKSLRPLFGDLVDRVQVNYNSLLMDRWSNGEQTVHVGDVDSAAQTYCDRVYVKDAYQPTNRGQFFLLAHELTHSAQCERLGGSNKFGYQYFRSYYEAGQQYAKNPLEKEARSIAAKLIVKI
jgi:Domain of unknown function (DUF4157)